MNYKYCLTGILLLSIKVWSQEIKPLSIGDKVPSINITNILNYSVSQTALSAFKGKLIILDFMATSCAGCIKVLPRFDSLQGAFGDKMQIILVSNEKRERLKKFLINSPYGNVSMPIIGEDTLLVKYFPYLYISHEVWIKDGIVKAITGTDHVTHANIKAILAGDVNWPVKNDLIRYDYSKMLVSSPTVPKSYSIITGYINGASFKHTMLTDTTGQHVRTRLFNLSIINLYLRSYGLKTLPASFMILKVKDTSHYVFDKAIPAWAKQNTYCYESLLPLTMQGKSMPKLRSDLNAFFQVSGRMEKRKMICNVLVRNATQVSNTTFNTSIENVLALLNNRYFRIPWINESGLTKIFIDPSMPVTDEEHFKKALEKSGISIKREERELDVFVLTENDLK